MSTSDSNLMKLQMQISNNVMETKLLFPEEIVLDHQHADVSISSSSQPRNDNVYVVPYTCESVTLPSSEKFTHPGFRIIITSPSASIALKMHDDDSRNVVTFQGSTYSSPEYFDLESRGFVEMVWTSGGWLVLSSYGLSVHESC